MQTMEEGSIRLLATFCLSITSSVLLIRFLGLTKEELIKINGIANDGFKRIRKVALLRA